MLLPGPEAQQLAIYIGWLMNRTAGGLIAGGLFVLPGFLAIMALSILYALYGSVGPVSALFVAGAQKRQANNDALAMGIGLVLFWPALFFLASGSDRREELARLKGDYDALKQAAIQKKCPVAEEIRSGRGG